MISFIIPTLNEEKVITKLLNNLKDIKTFDYEIIVSDGGSRDKTVDLAKTVAKRVVEHKDSSRQTIGQGRNAGAKVATGEFLVFLDADVHIYKPDEFFKRAMGHFEQDKKLVAVGGWLRVFPEAETLGDIIGYNILSNYSFSFYNNFLKVGAGCGEFGMIKTEAFRQIRGYREDLAVDEDQDLFHRLIKIGHTKTDPKLLIYHTGRRPHAIGWPKLLWQWTSNWVSLMVFNRSADSEWKEIR